MNYYCLSICFHLFLGLISAAIVVPSTAFVSHDIFKFVAAMWGYHILFVRSSARFIVNMAQFSFVRRVDNGNGQRNTTKNALCVFNASAGEERIYINAKVCYLQVETCL